MTNAELAKYLEAELERQEYPIYVHVVQGLVISNDAIRVIIDQLKNSKEIVYTKWVDPIYYHNGIRWTCKNCRDRVFHTCNPGSRKNRKPTDRYCRKCGAEFVEEE